MLESKGYDKLSNSKHNHADNDDGDAVGIDYKYLVKMPMDSVTEENVARLEKEHVTKSNELAVVKSTTIEQMWLGELSVLEGEYVTYKDVRHRLHMGLESVKKVGGGGPKSGAKKLKVV